MAAIGLRGVLGRGGLRRGRAAGGGERDVLSPGGDLVDLLAAHAPAQDAQQYVRRKSVGGQTIRAKAGAAATALSDHQHHCCSKR